MSCEKTVAGISIRSEEDLKSQGSFSTKVTSRAEAKNFESKKLCFEEVQVSKMKS